MHQKEKILLILLGLIIPREVEKFNKIKKMLTWTRIFISIRYQIHRSYFS